MKRVKSEYNHTEIEDRWQKEWDKNGTYQPAVAEAVAGKPEREPYYNLMMFPYPSAEGLHVGNVYAFTGADVWGRYQRLQGKDVFEPIGLDGFGIHSENFAIKIGAHPVEQAQKAEVRFYKQLQSVGNGFAWENRVETYNPNYYRWTQWLFVQMFKHGLAYRKKAAVNWCPSCKTVLADEQVIADKCERCSSTVERRDLEQWFFRITDYADRLLDNLEVIDWAQKVKIAQKQWIGRSEGALLKFEIAASAVRPFGRPAAGPRNDKSIEVFTTRPDTLAGATFMVVSPEHELARGVKLATVEGEKNGAFTSHFVINPATSKEIPVWVSDYVLSGYGTGAIMAVPAHDERDAEFAKKYDLPVVDVETEGSEEEIEKALKLVEKNGWGKLTVNYHLRDWLISRQRYWGPPIPMIYCQSCASAAKGELSDMPGWYSVPEKDLPVELPYVENFKPTGTGEAPLAQDKEWVKVKCPDCGAEARRETDVSDTFLDSAWYFLRYPSTNVDDKPFDEARTKKWLPVNMYIGGAEHSVLHLMYSRFVTMALKDWGYLDFEEPFTRFYAHGLIIKDGSKMSKSKGNVVVPDEYIKKFGADTLRMYLQFLGPFDQGGDFRDSGIEGMHRFVKRVWILVHEISNFQLTHARTAISNEILKRKMNQTIKRVTHDLDGLRYNRAISGVMEYVNMLQEQKDTKTGTKEEWHEAIRTLLLLLAPFAPHMTEELWQEYFQNHLEGAKTHLPGGFNSIHQEEWPKWDEKYILEDEMNISVQVNGKMRGNINISSGKIDDQEYIESEAKNTENIKKYIEDKKISRVIYVKGRLISFVIS